MHPDITLNTTSHGLPPAGHYSASVTAGGFVFISGQLPITPHGEKKAGASFEEQTRQVLENVDACLKGAGVSRQHLVSVRVYVTDINQWPTFNDIYAEWIGGRTALWFCLRSRSTRAGAISPTLNAIQVKKWLRLHSRNMLMLPPPQGVLKDMQTRRR